MTAGGYGGALCSRCFELAKDGQLWLIMVMPVPEGVGLAPLARDGSGPCCRDCQAADTILKLHPGIPGWRAARVAIGNDRIELLHGLPRASVVFAGLMATAPAGRAERDLHVAWLEQKVPNIHRFRLDAAWDLAGASGMEWTEGELNEPYPPGWMDGDSEGGLW